MRSLFICIVSPQSLTTALTQTDTRLLTTFSAPRARKRPASLFPTSGRWRKEGRQDVCLSEQWWIVGIYRWTLFIRQGCDVSPVLTAPSHVSGNSVITVESNCCSGAVLRWMEICSVSGFLPYLIPSSEPMIIRMYCRVVIVGNLMPDGWTLCSHSKFKSITEISLHLSWKAALTLCKSSSSE